MGMPISVCLGLSSMLAIFFFGNDSLASLSLKLFETSEHYTLMAIPFFILGGTLMSTGGDKEGPSSANAGWLKQAQNRISKTK